MLHGDRFRPRKPPFLHILEYVATDSGLVSPSSLVEVIAPDEKIDHSHSAVPQPASPPPIFLRVKSAGLICGQEETPFTRRSKLCRI